jgi:LEA14-like dessication related protein
MKMMRRYHNWKKGNLMAWTSPQRGGARLAMLLTMGLLGTLPGCALFFKAPAVEIMEVRVTSLGLSSGTAEVSLQLTNESSREMTIRGVLYEVEVRGPEEGGSWATLAEGFFHQPMEIPGNETETVDVPFPFEYAALGQALRSLLSSGEVRYRLRGEVWIGGTSAGLQIPFREEGVLRP